MRNFKPFTQALPEDAVPAKSSLQVFAAATDSEAEISITGDITNSVDWFTGEPVGISTSAVKEFLADNRGKDVKLYINSEGGRGYEGISMYNALGSHDGNVTAIIDGLAFSAASVVAMAADKIVMYEASDIGIHRAWGIAIGNQKDMVDHAAWLNNLDEHMLGIYSDRTGKDRKQVEEWMDGVSDGTLFSAKEAVEHGFADEMIPNKTKSRDKIKSAKSKLSEGDLDLRLRIAKARQSALTN